MAPRGHTQALSCSAWSFTHHGFKVQPELGVVAALGKVSPRGRKETPEDFAASQGTRSSRYRPRALASGERAATSHPRTGLTALVRPC